MSDNYIVSARKYRPQTFDTVVGQEHITTTLKNAIKNQHLAHAYLFCGPRGVGKTTCARILAKTINCESPTPDMEACGVCSMCQSFKNNASFNVFELDAASNNSVDDIRELTNQVRFAPQQGKYKVYIIDEVHMLSAAAFNAFLKTLEEPPPYAIFILATTEKHKILPTILSRCQIFDFKRITTNDIVDHLNGIATKEGMSAQEAALHIIAQKSEGCMRDALSMLDRIASFTNGMLTYSNTMEHLNLLDADFYFRLTDAMLSQDVASTLVQFDNALERGFEGDVIMNGLAEHLRNLLLCKDSRMARLLDVPKEHQPMYNEKANQTPPSFILSALNVLNDAELNYKNATNRRLHVEMCLIRLCYLLQSVAGDKIAVSSSSGVLAEAEAKKNINTVDRPVMTFQPAAVSTNITPVQQVYTTPAVVAEVLQEPVVKVQAAPVAQPVAPPPPPVAAKPAAPAEQKPAAATPPPATAGGRGRIGFGLINDLDAAVSKAAASQNQEQKVLTEAVALEVFERYKEVLRADGKGSVLGQFALMHISVAANDQLHIVACNVLNETYAKEQRTHMQDFYRAATGMIVRITTEIKEDEEAKAREAANKVLSKNEIFEVMAQKNPDLARLRDALGLQIEY